MSEQVSNRKKVKGVAWLHCGGYEVVAETDEEGCLVLTVRNTDIHAGRDTTHVLVEDNYNRPDEEGGWVNAYRVVPR